MPEITTREFQSDLASSVRSPNLDCLTISHPQIDTVRLVDNTVNIERTIDGRPQTFLRFPIETVYPEQTTQRPPRLKIKSGIVDQRVIRLLRQLRGYRKGAQITAEAVRGYDFDVVIYRGTFTFIDLKTNGDTVAEITAGFIGSALENAYPAGRFGPANAKA